MGNKRLYVGNLPYATSNEDLAHLFAQYGTVLYAQVCLDRDTGRSKGFGFVEMNTVQEAQKANQALHGQPFDGRPLTVSEARPRQERQDAAGNGGRR